MKRRAAKRTGLLRRVVAGVGGLAVASALLGLAPGAVTSTAAGSTPAASVHVGLGPGGPIQHVVILYQENHTFDDVLGQLCQTRVSPCNGYVGPVTFADGNTAENVVEPDKIPVISHDPNDQRNGLAGAWDKIPGCTVAPYACVTHIDPANIPNLTRLATKFTVSDATFAAGHSASFGAHVTLGAGTFDGYTGWNPVNSKTGVRPRYGFGCQSRKDVLWGPLGDHSYQPTCVPDRKGRGPYRPTLVPYTPTIMERMEQAGLTWHIYENSEYPGQPADGIWSICTYFAWCWLHRYDIDHDSDPSAFRDSAAAGTLPNLSILIPGMGVSQHNWTSMAMGDNYIGRIVKAVQQGPDWNSTAIFITYDDCGCFYDHVTPPSRKMGLRNPMVIISPWVKRGGTDSTPAVQPYSMLSFTEQVFGLAPLTKQVSGSYDYANSFDFSQRPLTGVPMTHTTVPLSERLAVRRAFPLIAKDPT